MISYIKNSFFENSKFAITFKGFTALSVKFMLHPVLNCDPMRIGINALVTEEGAT